MSLPFPINPSAMPMVRTRKALMILDLQNDFVSPDGALYTGEPEGYVERTLDLAKAFRDSGAGDVIWIRTECERPCPLLDHCDQIVTSDAMVREKKPASPRGRQQTSVMHESAAMENDEEAFLSIGSDKEKQPCVRKGTEGAEFAPQVKAAVVTGRDIVFIKTHYSAFASGQQQLVQMLRGRFVTQLYVCGALTNISIYATALGAGQHGYDVTLVEDCCGFRSMMRHLNAVRQLDHLTGCQVIGSDSLLEQLRPPAPSLSTGLSPSISKISLELGGGSPDASPAPSPPSEAKPASPQPRPKSTTPPRRGSSTESSHKVDRKRPLVEEEEEDTGQLEAESDPSSSSPPSDCESRQDREKKVREIGRNEHPPKAKRSELESSKGPDLPPGADSAQAEQPRIVDRVKQSVRRCKSDKNRQTSPSFSNAAIRSKTTTEVAEPKPEVPSTTSTITSPPEQSSHGNMAEQQPTPQCSEPLCEGDTHLITNVLPPAIAADAFERLLEEVSWASMSHMGGEVPRRIAVQGTVADDGSMPVYRHPADESPPLLPFSPTVLQIKNEVEKHLGHPLNHVLIQHYRTGNDYISEHSDKTLDIAPGSFIANLSLGAERTMIFRTKRPPKDQNRGAPSAGKPASDDRSEEKGEETGEKSERAESSTQQQQQQPQQQRQTQRASLPHNSLLRMGLRTNARWLHAIRQDKRADRDKTDAERDFGGARISLTFRRIGTFIDAAHARIWGQGAVAKTRDAARPVVNGQTDDAVRLLKAFGAENNRGSAAAGDPEGFDWDEWYGDGFDVLHMGTPKRFYPSSSAGGAAAVGNVSVALALAELGVSCAKGSVEGAVRFEDNDPGRAVVEGQAVVLRYLDAVYGAGRRYDQLLPGEVAKRFGRLQRGLDLLGKWKAALNEVGVSATGASVDNGNSKQQEVGAEQVKALAKSLKKELSEWEVWGAEEAAAVATGDGEEKAGGAFYIAGGAQPSPADFALWPVLHDMVRVCGEELLGEKLRRYYTAFKERSSVAKALGQLKE
ncbi:hypothetical protein VTI28DRAFT_6690 [Corynascus sepedonium]